MNEKVVIDGQVNLLTQVIGDPKALIPADCKEYETGTIHFGSAVQYYGITFKLAHTVAPTIVAFYDQTGTYDSTASSLYAWVYINHQTLFGTTIYPSQASAVRTITYMVWRSTYQNSFNTQGVYNFGDVTNTHAIVRVPNVSPVPMLRPGRTYKWIAIWG